MRGLLTLLLWMTYRAAVRTACNTRQTEIDNCSDVAALKEAVDWIGDAALTMIGLWGDDVAVMSAKPGDSLALILSNDVSGWFG